MPNRSGDPLDYQAVPRAIAAMAKSFPTGFHIARHHHDRDQLLWSVSGTMRVRTDDEAWIVPPDRAVYLPAQTEHAIDIRGEVGMRTLYIAPDIGRGLPAKPMVLEVSDLLRALVLALVEEPLLYDETGRGGAIAALTFSEIAKARPLPFMLPMPKDPRIGRICEALLDDPALDRTLDTWADEAGASARTLARLFERELGMGFAAWRQRVRLHSATEALVTGQSIAAVAARNGYRSTSAFTVAFRKTMGLAPSAVRGARDLLSNERV